MPKQSLTCKICGEAFTAYFYPERPRRYCSKSCVRKDVQHGYSTSFLDKDTELRSYFLGLWVTDGSIVKQANKMKITTDSTDYQIINDLRKVTKYKNRIYKRTYPDKNWKTRYTLAYSGNIAERIVTFGFLPKAKTGKEFVPECITKRTFPHFLRGVIDGDGSIVFDKNKRKLHTKIVCMNLSFVQDLYKRIKKYTNVKGGCIYKNRMLHELHFSDRDSKLVGSYVYNNASLYLKRKYKVFKNEKLGLRDA